jgi:hypothetical protein
VGKEHASMRKDKKRPLVEAELVTQLVVERVKVA